MLATIIIVTIAGQKFLQFSPEPEELSRRRYLKRVFFLSLCESFRLVPDGSPEVGDKRGSGPLSYLSFPGHGTMAFPFPSQCYCV